MPKKVKQQPNQVNYHVLTAHIPFYSMPLQAHIMMASSAKTLQHFMSFFMAIAGYCSLTKPTMCSENSGRPHRFRHRKPNLFYNHDNPKTSLLPPLQAAAASDHDKSTSSNKGTAEAASRPVARKRGRSATDPAAAKAQAAASPAKSSKKETKSYESPHFLMKSEPDEFSIDHLAAQPGATSCWDGVRNMQVRHRKHRMWMINSTFNGAIKLGNPDEWRLQCYYTFS